MERKKEKTFVYTAIVLAGLIAYCGFAIKDGYRAVDRLEENVPESYTEGAAFEATEATEATETETLGKAIENASAAPVSAILEDVPEETATSYPKEFSPAMPLSGEVTRKFSKTLVYNERTGDWRAHWGIDIAAKKTELVCAAEDGVIAGAYEDPLYGKTIEIDHGEYRTVYKNLSTLVMVEEGESIYKGDGISGVGDSAAFEKADGAHLHFEIIKNGENIDPLEVIETSSVDKEENVG